MSGFYEGFETNLSRIVQESRDIIVRQYERLLRRFDIDRSFINLEIECRYKAAGNDKVASRIISELESQPQISRSEKRITDNNYSLEVQEFRMTFRESTENKVEENETRVEEYLKIPVYIPRSTNLYGLLDSYRDYGMKIQFSFEISDPGFITYVRETYKSQFNTTPYQRVKDRQTLIDSRKPAYRWDITQVTNPERPRKEIEVELDATYKFDSEFMANDPEGLLKNFFSYAEINSRKLVYKSRSLISEPQLKGMIRDLNEALGSNNPRDAFIENIIPQVRNIQVENLLKPNYGQGFAVTPKADGYRYFMIFTQRHIVLLQKPSIYKVLYEGPDIPGQWVGFIFDGELVEKDNWIKKNLNPAFLSSVDNYYCIFDVVKFPADIYPVVDDILGRINELKKIFEETKRSGSKLLKWSETFNSFNFQPPYIPILEAVKKTFFEIKPYDDASGSPWAATGSFFDTLRPKLKYVDDGLIFTPLGKTYQELNKDMSLKWKPLELLSIDFRFIGGSLLVTLENREVPFQGSMQFPTKTTVYNILNPANLPLRDGLIYEFIYELNDRKFRVTRPRFDKQVPNRYDVALQVWNDIHRPISQNMISGEGFDGLRECRRESLWSWFRDLVVNMAPKSILDLSNIDPVRDFPLRFLDEEFPRIMRGTSMKRLDEYRDEEIDLLIMDGGMAYYLQGADDVMLASIPNIDFYEKMRSLVKKSKRIFIRSLPAIIEGESPNDFVTDRLAVGNNEELTLHYIDENRIRIKCMGQGLFYDFTIDSYASVSEITAKKLIPPSEDTIIVSAGNRVSNFQDQGPDNILNGKHFGIFWRYVFNVLTDAKFFQTDILEPLSQTETLDLVQMMEQLTVDQQTTQREPIPEIQPIVSREDVFEDEPPIRVEEDYPDLPDMNFETRDASREFLERATLKLERELEPISGNILEIITKAIMIMNQRLGTPYSTDLTMENAADLKLLFGRMSEQEIVEMVFSKFGLGLVICRRVGEKELITSLRTQFPDPGLGIPKYGYILVESSQDSLNDLKSPVGLLTYGPENNVVIHPSDPIIKTLYIHNSRILYLNKRGITLMRKLAKAKQIRPIKDVTDRPVTMIGTPLAFQTKELGAQLSSFVNKLKRSYKPEELTESIVMSELQKSPKAVINDLLKTMDLILQDNIENSNNLAGRVLMSYRSKLLTKI